MQDILESDDEDTGPGPGAYYNGQQTNFKNETKPQRLQFFGSTVERFTDQSKYKVNEEVGPGSYAITGSTFSSKRVVPTAVKGREKVSF